MRDLAKLCLLLLAACGGGNNKLPDAPPGTPDGPPGQPDAMVVGTVTVHVSQEDFDPLPGAPIEGARIAVIAPGGAMTMYSTDITGVATFEAMTGSAMWVGRDPESPPAAVPGLPSYDGRLYYLASIAPGDDIALGAVPGGPAGTDGTLTINYTPQVAAGPGYYDNLLANCTDYGDNSVPGMLTFNVYSYASSGRGCGGGAARELVMTTTDLVTGAPNGWLTVPNVTTEPGTIDATGLGWDDTGTTYTVTHSNQPADVTYAYSYFRSGGSWHGSNTQGSISGGTGTYSITDATLPLPMVVATELYNQLGLPQWVVDPVINAESSHAIDGATVLPYIASPAFDPATRTISWSTATPGPTAPQIVTASFSYYDSASSTQFRWTIYAPGDATELVIPDVPDAVAGHDLQPGEFVYPDLWLINVEGSDYDDLLTDLDLYRNDPTSGYRLGSRVLASGGYDIGK